MKGFLKKIALKWDDQLLTYEATCCKLAETDLAEALVAAVSTAERQVERFSDSPTSFTVPMTKDFLHSTFGADAYQLCSGASVVVMVPSAQKVYKYPIQASAWKNLHTMIRSNHYDYRYTAVPTEIPLHSPLHKYVMCDAYLPPLDKNAARRYILPFIEKVVAAIGELHDSGFAHLDIRLENICLQSSNGDYDAVLIDLDRSRPKTELASSLYFHYNAEMYRCPNSTWTYENLDWKQLGLLIQFILDVPDVRSPLSNCRLAATIVQLAIWWPFIHYNLLATPDALYKLKGTLKC